jgi:hypothetical protein
MVLGRGLSDPTKNFRGAIFFRGRVSLATEVSVGFELDHHLDEGIILLPES